MSVIDDLKAFVIAWQGASTIKEVMEVTGLSKQDVMVKSRALRKKGVNLKSMVSDTRNLTSKDIAALNELI